MTTTMLLCDIARSSQLMTLEPAQYSNSVNELIVLLRKPLGLNGLDLRFQITALVGRLVTSRNNPWRMGEEIVHLLKWPSRRLRKEKVEEQSVCQIADDEQNVESVPDVVHRDRSDLSNHGVESEGGHGC